jgi:hypothetical protein
VPSRASQVGEQYTWSGKIREELYMYAEGI